MLHTSRTLAELVSAIREGEQDAATEFVQRYWDHVIRFVQRKLNRWPELRPLFDPDDFANDALCEFINRVQQGEMFEDGARVMAFLMRTA